MSKYLLVQDDCAPDSLEVFDRNLKEKFNLTRKDFHNGICKESKDGLHIEHHFKGYILSFDGDDPYYKLSKR
jgi:hypothetical protein